MSGAGRGRPTVALVGVHGYGRLHLERLLARQHRGEIDLVAVADPVPADAALEGARQFPALDDLLAVHGPEVVVVSTPLHTHADLAGQALRAGAHVLVEKPATADLPSFEELLALSERTSRWCQVGFQSLGSAAVEHVRERVAGGRIGTVTGYSAVGCWVRTRAYYDRAPWAGRRRLQGRVVADGVLTNPLAHAVATVLAVAGARRLQDVVEVETDLFHVNDIEADDTSTARIVLGDGLDVLVAVTLAAAEQGEPFVTVTGTAGSIRLFYTLDTVVEETPGRPPRVTRHERVDLFDDLLDAVRTGARPRSALREAGGFARVQDAVVNSPAPRAVPAEFLRRHDLPGGDVRWELPGIEEAVQRAVTRRRTFSELDLDWARAAR
ncbi:Gfo/Idh/MocA family protein [Kineococcus sp. LSe6-4]|uniref:Gfo/Idh/MocA family protein n=1 Tax=Kineococcus halophytocola TaxID=3234027 RepID=A0ABV4GY99_9ACTN